MTHTAALIFSPCLVEKHEDMFPNEASPFPWLRNGTALAFIGNARKHTLGL